LRIQTLVSNAAEVTSFLAGRQRHPDSRRARTRQIGAQRDRVIASYTLLSAVGRLDVHALNLNTPDYAPDVHYHQVRDAWHGLRTPSGQ